MTVSPPSNVPIFQTGSFHVPSMVKALTSVRPAGILSVSCKLVIGPTPKFLTWIVKVAVSPSVISALSTDLLITISGSQKRALTISESKVQGPLVPLTKKSPAPEGAKLGEFAPGIATPFSNHW